MLAVPARIFAQYAARNIRALAAMREALVLATLRHRTFAVERLPVRLNTAATGV